MPRLNHKKLMDLMLALDYPCNRDGVCHGVAMMGIQSFLVGELAIFNDRLHFIAAHPDLYAAIMRVKEKLARESIASMPPKKLNLSEEEQNVIDTLAFFEGISLYQYPYKCPAYLGSTVTQFHTDIISNITQSTQLERKGGLIKVMSWLGIYDDNELEKYVRFLNETAAKVNYSFSMLIASGNHGVAILYDHIAAKWQVLDVNRLPAEPKDITQLAAWIKTALAECGEMTAFESTIYLTRDAGDKAQQFKDMIGQSSDFISLHEITERKKDACDSRHVTFAFLAARGGHIGVIKMLHEMKADLNKANINGATTVFIASEYGHADVVKMLHEIGADLNQARNDGVTPLLAAVKYNYVDVIRVLLEAGVGLNCAEKDGATPAFVAAQNGRAGVIQALHQAGADLSQARKDGATPAVIAASMNKPDVLAALEVANVDLGMRTNVGTPLDNAIKSGSTDCIHFLTDYMKRKPIQHSPRLFVSQDGSQAGVVKVPLRKLAPRNFSY